MLLVAFFDGIIVFKGFVKDFTKADDLFSCTRCSGISCGLMRRRFARRSWAFWAAEIFFVHLPGFQPWSVTHRTGKPPFLTRSRSFVIDFKNFALAFPWPATRSRMARLRRALVFAVSGYLTAMVRAIISSVPVVSKVLLWAKTSAPHAFSMNRFVSARLSRAALVMFTYWLLKGKLGQITFARVFSRPPCNF